MFHRLKKIISRMHGREAANNGESAQKRHGKAINMFSIEHLSKKAASVADRLRSLARLFHGRLKTTNH